MPQMAMSKRILLEMHFIAEDFRDIVYMSFPFEIEYNRYKMKSIPLDENEIIPFGIMANRCNTANRCLNRPCVF